MKLVSQYMIVKKTFKKYSKIYSESYFLQEEKCFWFTNSALTLTNAFLEAGALSPLASAVGSSPVPWNTTIEEEARGHVNVIAER